MASTRVRLALAALLVVENGAPLAQEAPAEAPVAAADAYDQAVSHPIFEDFAPRIFVGPPRSAARPDDSRAGPMGILQGSGPAAWPLLYRDEKLTIEASVAATLGLFAFRDNQFSLPASQATPSYRNDPSWGEFFVQPGVTAQWRLSDATSLYGGVAYLETATRGTDYDGVGNTWHGDMEQLYGGVRWEDKARRLQVDLAYGHQSLVLGQSFLIASGASNGEQRGANYVGPRTNWQNAAIGRATIGDVAAQAFWLKPNDSTSAGTGTRISGIEIAWDKDGPLRGAATYLYVPESAIVTREGLNVYDVRVRWHPSASVSNAWLAGEYAWERKSGVSASGWYAAANYNAKDLTWKPLVTLRYAWFSGDKPGTAAWEGFDPLYFGGGDPDWYQGKLASTLFNNTNLASLAASITLTPTERNLLQVIAVAFRAVEVNAPLAVPEPNQPATTGGGVPNKALANEVDVVWTYTASKRVNVNVFAAYAAPGAGYKDLYASQGGSARAWSGLGMQVNVNY
ncbi:MAG: alginate export family protein [Burkholderiales bacterium]